MCQLLRAIFFLLVVYIYIFLYYETGQIAGSSLKISFVVPSVSSKESTWLRVMTFRQGKNQQKSIELRIISSQILTRVCIYIYIYIYSIRMQFNDQMSVGSFVQKKMDELKIQSGPPEMEPYRRRVYIYIYIYITRNCFMD